MTLSHLAAPSRLNLARDGKVQAAGGQLGQRRPAAPCTPPVTFLLGKVRVIFNGGHSADQTGGPVGETTRVMTAMVSVFVVGIRTAIGTDLIFSHVD